ncbi:MAG: carboxypeptidase-like regulatory domain-containing protein [Chitinophagales bacterium]
MLCAGITLAQTATSRVVDENNEPMFGVNVIEKGTTNGVTTDFDGKFSLNLTKENPVIIFRFVGYRAKSSLQWNGCNPKMEVDEIGLDAVVICFKRKRVLDAPASVSLINAEKIENTAT